MADRLLDIDVGPGLHGGDRLQWVPMVGRGDDDDLRLLLLQEFAEVAVFLGRCAGELFDLGRSGVQLALVHVAQRDDLGPAGLDRLAEDVHPPPARADQGRFVDLVLVGTEHSRGGERKAGRCTGRQEFASSNSHRETP